MCGLEVGKSCTEMGHYMVSFMPLEADFADQVKPVQCTMSRLAMRTICSWNPTDKAAEAGANQSASKCAKAFQFSHHDKRLIMMEMP